VQEQPGITIAQLAEKMGISKTYLYRVLPGLQKDGKITNQGRGWHPKK
jgi:DNA-binding IscR family transcriptional regulator